MGLSLFLRAARGTLARLRGDVGWSRGARLVVVALAGGVFFVGERDPVEARQYSAYANSEKPVISVVLSDPGNVEDLQEQANLTDEQVEEMLAAVREENRDLARLYAQSEEMVEENRNLSQQQVKEKISDFGYNDKVAAEVKETKLTIEQTLPKSQQAEFEAFMTQSAQQTRRCRGTRDPDRQPRRGLVERVYATQYHGYTRYEVALPHRKLKFDGGYRVRISRKGKSVWAPVKEVGPWNTYDNYWQSRRYRTMWKRLPRGKPEAEAAYCNDFHNGRDEKGRRVLNPAGVDLTPAVARRLGLRKYQNAWVVVYYPWVRR